MMKTPMYLLVLLLFTLIVTESSARKELLTSKQKELLEKAERILVEAIAITDHGSIDPAPLAEV
ncbi:MAG TPA: hypothetical protein VFL31_07070, partial [Nitrospiraceae bacterium]|nr:hypothetical protein [Nitrospiraceae bacterium]